LNGFGKVRWGQNIHHLGEELNQGSGEGWILHRPLGDHSRGGKLKGKAADSEFKNSKIKGSPTRGDRGALRGE